MRFSRPVAFARKGEGAEQRHAEAIGVGRLRSEPPGGAVGADRVGAGGPVADLVDALDRFHVSASASVSA